VDGPDQQQQQQQQQQNGGGGGDGGAADVVTNSSWRMFKWMRDYAALMRWVPPRLSWGGARVVC
jgi:hypothetical protein